jgi:hypothetical protein
MKWSTYDNFTSVSSDKIHSVKATTRIAFYLILELQVEDVFSTR